MPRIKKKGESGNAKNYMTRSQAVRKLQINLGDFRRLCIFKGIYPREPRSKKKVSASSTPSTTFYYTKDISYLLHEPLLAKFRDQKALAKKISKALGRNEVSDASRLEKNHTPKLRLDHIIKERYPTFVDALRDLDDALSMLFLFANLPSTESVPPKTIALCQRLTHEFEHYLIRTHSMRKSFLSIKGIYYQATIQGQDILWLVPYRFVQRAGGDIDFRIMATFVEFYTTLLAFVNYRLYTSIGLVYPPKFDAKSEEQGAELGAFSLEGKAVDGRTTSNGAIGEEATNERAQAEADRLRSLPAPEEEPQSSNNAPQSSYATAPETSDGTEEEQQNSTALDKFSTIDPTADALLQPSLTADSGEAGKLFESFTFFLSRETPRHPLEFLLKSFGCKRVGWDAVLGEGSYCNADDTRVTHQVVDRPDIPLPAAPTTEEEQDPEAGVVPQQAQRVPGRIYIQPQWIWDSINLGQLQRTDFYAPGAVLPPHLSPWVKPKAGQYDPTAPLPELEAGAEESEDEEEEVDGVRDDEATSAMEKKLKGKEVAGDSEEEEDDGGMDVELAASEDEDDEEVEEEEDEEFGGFDSEPEEPDAATKKAQDHQAELEAEALGLPVTKDAGATPAKALKAKRTREEREKQEEIERLKGMMPRRKRKMFEKMQYSNAQKDAATEKLQGKRRKIEKARK